MKEANKRGLEMKVGVKTCQLSELKDFSKRRVCQSFKKYETYWSWRYGVRKFLTNKEKEHLQDKKDIGAEYETS